MTLFWFRKRTLSLFIGACRGIHLSWSERRSPLGSTDQQCSGRWHIINETGTFAKKKSATQQHLSGYHWATDVALIWGLVKLLNFCWGNNGIKLICCLHFYAHCCGVTVAGCKLPKSELNRLAGHDSNGPGSSQNLIIYGNNLWVNLCVEDKYTKPIYLREDFFFFKK